MISALGAALSSLFVPLRALLVALLGAGSAWLWFRGDQVVLIVLIALALLVALLLDAGGRGLLPTHPRAAVELLEWWLLAPMALAASAAAAAIVVTVELTVPDGTAAADKEVIGAIATAITAFLSTSFVDWAGDDKDSKLSDRIQEQFEAKYQGHFRSLSQGELYVYSQIYKGADGWSRKSRRIRAAGIADRLAPDKAP